MHAWIPSPPEPGRPPGSRPPGNRHPLDQADTTPHPPGARQTPRTRQTPPDQADTPQDQADPPGPGRHPPPREADCSIRLTSGRYASYWNAFLFYLVLADTILVVPAYSLLCFIGGIYVLSSVPLSGLIFDETQSYNVSYITYGIMGVCATAIEGFIPYFERKKNIQEDVKKELR